MSLNSHELVFHDQIGVYLLYVGSMSVLHHKLPSQLRSAVLTCRRKSDMQVCSRIQCSLYSETTAACYSEMFMARIVVRFPVLNLKAFTDLLKSETSRLLGS